MFESNSQYDRGVNTFSPEGRLYQVEYAMEAIKLGNTAIGLQTKSGVLLAVEKKLASKLQEQSGVEKIMEIDRHIGCAMAGLIADARTIVDHGRLECQNHSFTYNEPMKVKSVTQSICDLALSFGEGGDKNSMSRPFGVALLIAGYDEKGPQLYFADPSGSYYQMKAKAIGTGADGAQSTIEESYSEDMSIEEAETLALRIMKEVMEKKLSTENVEMCVVTAESGYNFYSGETIDAILARLE